MLRYTTDRARPGLVALYDVRPGNGAGPFSQPRSPHGGFLRQTNVQGTIEEDTSASIVIIGDTGITVCNYVPTKFCTRLGNRHIIWHTMELVFLLIIRFFK